MEIINTALSLRLTACLGSALLLSSTDVFAGDLVLHKVPAPSENRGSATHQSADASAQTSASTVALVSYNRVARPLYVSSGSDMAQADTIVDEQVSTSYSFAADDAAPATVIDLGQAATLRRLSAVYAPRAVKVDFYLVQAMPNAAAEGTPDLVRLDDATLANMKSVGSMVDDGTLGRATVEFPATTGRYVMVRWTPTAQQDSAFTVAEVSAVAETNQNASLVAGRRGANSGRIAYDGKTALDGKTMFDGKEMMPGEGPAEEVPESPGEGPPPTLPQPPPFAFVPILVPVSP